MPIRHVKSTSYDCTGRVRTHDKVETVWLQRSTANMPWGFRMIGGSEFGLPLTIQRVTPGSVAAAALGSGDVIIKIGNVMATNLEHSEAQDLVRESGNVLQLTVKKPGGPVLTDSIPSSDSEYGNQLSIHVDGYNAIPKGFGVGIPLNNNFTNKSETTHYATTPRNFGSQRQPYQATQVEIQNSNPVQQRNVYNNSYNDEDMDNGGLHLPDYTIAYRKQELVHDSPGGPDNIRGYFNTSGSSSYNTKSLPRGAGGYRSNDLESVGGLREPETNELRTSNGSLSSLSSNASVDAKFSTGIPFTSGPHTPQQSVISPAPQPLHSIDNSTQPAYNSLPRPVSPQTFSGPLSQRQEKSPVPELASKEATLPAGNVSAQATYYQSASSGDDHSMTHTSGNDTYTPAPSLKLTHSTNSNNSFSVYKSTPQPYSAPKPYAPSQASVSSSFNQVPMPFTAATQFKPSSAFNTSHSVIRKVSLDNTAEESGVTVGPTNFTARPFKPVQSVSSSTYSNPAQIQPSNQYDNSHDDNRTTDFGASTQHAKSDILYTATPYTPSLGSVSPHSDLSDDSGMRDGVSNVSLASSTELSLPSPPLPPPPPSFFSPPPVAPPIWNPVPYKRPSYQPNEESEEQKIPDQLLSTVLSSAKSGTPKPFSYGIDLSELKKKIGPPTAPKPKGGQSSQQGQGEDPETQDQFQGYRKKSVGQIQSDFYINKESNPDPTFKAPKKPAGQVQSDYLPSRQTGVVDPAFKVPKKPVGQMQSDYLPSRQTGIKSDIGDADPTFKASKIPVGQVQSDYMPSQKTGTRGEIDESPININMGTNPRKQSKSFKVLQWMTETEQEELEEPSQKAKRNKDPERRHNADDDEMRFSGLNSNAEIPSKTFGILQRMSSNDDELAAIHNGKTMLNVGDSDEGNGGLEDPALRYKGRNIPSPSFRLLQTWAELDPDPATLTQAKREESTNEDFSDMVNNEEMADMRYTGGNIPSKVFKVLQKSLGDDPQEISLQQNNTEPGSVHSLSPDVAPISEF
ncbi:hypothetical protein BsWGS_06369 [Bradybaena similaris]